MALVQETLNPNGKGRSPRYFWNSLRTGMIAAFILLSVAPLALALVSAISRSSTGAREQVTKQLRSIADAKAQSIEYNLTVEQEHLHEVFADPAGRQIALDLLSGSEAVDDAQEAVMDYLRAIQTASGAYEELFVYNPRGEILASSNPIQVGKIIFRQPYFEPGLTGDYLQPPFYEVGSQDLNIILARPVVNDQSEVVGALAGRLNLDQLNTVMSQRAGLGETGETYLVSLENNYLVTSSRFEGYSLTQSYHSLGIDQALAGDSGADVYQNYRGQVVIGAYEWLPNLQVALLAEIEEDEALRNTRQATRDSIGVAIATAAIAAVVGLVLAIRVTRPITDLTNVAREFSAGNLAARAKNLARNEIGQLGQAFNSMAGRLQKTVGDLEMSVEEARRANAEAQEANRLKDLFLATMSHELRTPLNAMIGFLGLMLYSEQLDEDNTHMAERSIANADRLLGLINNILDLSRISSGRLEITPVDMSPYELVEAVRDDMAAQFEETALEFRVSVDPSLPAAIRHDEERLTQIVTNLIGNAIKFTPQGEVRFNLTRHDSRLVIEVSDTGIGIPLTKQQLIFDEFVQVDSSSTRKFGGAGLGLSIVKNLSVLMDGAVRVDSTPGIGSTFTVELPLNLEHRPNLAPQAVFEGAD